MSTHLYCFLPPTSLAALPRGLTGVDDAPVRALEASDMVAWVSTTEPRAAMESAIAQSAALSGIRDHDAVVEQALSAGVTPLPARFGQRFRDDDACVAGIARNAGAISALLSAMQGLVEMTLILTPSTRHVVADLLPVLPEMVAEEAGAGRRYLEALKQREAMTGVVRDALDALARRLSDAAEVFVRRVSVHENLAKMPMRTISHLIARESVDEYRDIVRSVHPTSDYRFILVGPRAPYSFASLGSSGDASHGFRLAEP
jgi:hypothetical protein